MWQDIFKYNPIVPLIEYNDKAVSLATQRDLLNKKISLQDLWQLTEPQNILRKQNKNGSWEYPGGKKHIRTKENYNQLETYRNLGVLIEKYGFTNQHSAIQNAAEYLLHSKQKRAISEVFTAINIPLTTLLVLQNC